MEDVEGDHLGEVEGVETLMDLMIKTKTELHALYLSKVARSPRAPYAVDGKCVEADGGRGGGSPWRGGGRGDSHGSND
jgi:hypothetical protein